MTNPLRTKLQARVRSEYLHGQALRHQMQGKSPGALERKYGMDRKTMRRVANGYVPSATNSKRTPEELAVIIGEYKAYMKLREEWLEYTTDAIALRYGITKSTVHRYGNGDFGMQNSPNMPRTVDPELLVSNSVERFLTMPSVVRNPVQGFYY